jgi:hypothetical protein
MKFQSKSNDGGHVTSRLTIPMTASMDKDILTVPVITAQVAQLQANGGVLVISS